MKKILLIIILFMLMAPNSEASEIFGQISTNPNAPAGGGNNPPAETGAPAVRGGAVILPAGGARIEEPEKLVEKIQSTIPKPTVLGIKIYPDGALLRGADEKIYLIEGQNKKRILNLAELKKFSGKAIYEATAEELSSFRTRGHSDGELIRPVGEAKVYVIKKGLKRHVLNLEELRENYFGREIFNVSGEEMALY